MALFLPRRGRVALRLILSIFVLLTYHCFFFKFLFFFSFPPTPLHSDDYYLRKSFLLGSKILCCLASQAFYGEVYFFYLSFFISPIILTFLFPTQFRRGTFQASSGNFCEQCGRFYLVLSMKKSPYSTMSSLQVLFLLCVLFCDVSFCIVCSLPLSLSRRKTTGHRMLFEVTILAFDSVACGVENKTVNPRTRARARLIVKVYRFPFSFLFFSFLFFSFLF